MGHGEHGPRTWDTRPCPFSTPSARFYFPFGPRAHTSRTSFSPSYWRLPPTLSVAFCSPRFFRSRSVMPVSSRCIFNRSILQASVLLPDTPRTPRVQDIAPLPSCWAPRRYRSTRLMVPRANPIAPSKFGAPADWIVKNGRQACRQNTDNSFCDPCRASEMTEERGVCIRADILEISNLGDDKNSVTQRH